MQVYHALYWVYFMIAAFSIGAMAFAGVLNLVAIRKFKLGLNSIAAYRVLMSAGYSLVVGTILWLTLGARVVGVQPTVGYFTYVTGAFLAAIGAIGLALKNVALHVDMEYHQSDLNDHS